MLNLTDDDKLLLKCNDFFRVKNINLSSGSYYIKCCSESEAFKELLGKKIFDIVGIKCPNYYYYKEMNYLIIEDLNSLYGFKYIGNYYSLFEGPSLDDVRTLFDTLCNNKNEINLQLNIMHFIDILFSNSDRHENNYGIYFDKDINGYLAVFDNGLMLDYFKMPTKPYSFCLDDVHEEYKKSECEFFINNSSNELRNYFNMLLFKFNPRIVYLLMNQIERENNFKYKNKNKTMIDYIKNYIMVFSIVNKIKKQNYKKLCKKKTDF